MRVLLIIPAYNEEANILRVIRRVREYRETCPFRLDYVVINDGSTDGTERVCLENGIHHIRLLQNLGIGGRGADRPISTPGKWAMTSLFSSMGTASMT